MSGIILLGLAGCAGRRAPEESALPPFVVAPGHLCVTLAFGGRADLDLYVTDPTLETTYFAKSKKKNSSYWLFEPPMSEASKTSTPRITTKMSTSQTPP